MKNLLKKLSSVLCLAMIMILASVSVACGGGSNNANNIEANLTNNDSTIEVNQPENVNDSESSEEDVAQIDLNGIYKFNSTYSFDDIYYEDLNDLLEFFETRDINGVYDATKKLGFDEFVNNITSYDSYSRALIFNSNTCLNLGYDEENIYSYIDEGANFEYTIADDGTITTNNTSIIEYDEESDTITIYFMFTYDNNGETVETPLYVLTTLSKVAYSENINSGVNYVYNENTLVLKTTSTNSISFDSYNTILKDMFNVNENENVYEAIVEYFSSITVNVSEDMSTLIFNYDDGSFEIIHINTDATYTLGNVSFSVSERLVDITTGNKIVSASISLDNETFLCFDFIEV